MREQLKWVEPHNLNGRANKLSGLLEEHSLVRGILNASRFIIHTKRFQSRFAEVNSPQKSFNLSSTITNMMNNVTDLCGN